ncbi:uncharacterized protein LOC123864787 [Maniola jurtina]|uniref:uncharacterized protein LOC123864787 n=1 Tax=Maniola jurtina TaxID=191418 RepID=UPI001E68CC59|nr:uncharacterized protein LOC123864787 [Maniola jurtina]
MSFVHFKMALARYTILIFILFYKQGIRGQQSAPSVGQNSLNQGPQNNQGTTQENSIQNQNGNSANKASIFNAQVPVNFQSLNPQSTISTQSTLSLQQPQRTSQPINLQLSQIPNFQQAFTVQPSLQFDTSFLQKPTQQSVGLQQPQNLQQSRNVYNVPVIQQIPCTKQLNPQQSVNLMDFNIQQQVPIANPVVKQIPVQSSQGIPNAAFISSSPSVSAILSCPCQRTDNTNNLGANYFPSTARAYPIIETPQISTPYSTLPVMAFRSTPTPTPLLTHTVMPYGGQSPDILESPLRVSNNVFIEDETKDLNQDNLISLLLSLLQSPKKSSKSEIPSGFPINSYLSSYLNQGSKPSSIKSLLPLILNMLSERREGCGCSTGCQSCEQKRMYKEDAEPRIYEGYSKKRDYSLRDDMFQKDGSEGGISRMVREHKKSKKLKNSIPVDSCEDEDADCGDCSEEDEN